MLLAIEDLVVRYGGAEIIDNISMHIDNGEIVTLIGNNGAGKTTLLRTLSGLKKSAAGKISFNGKNIDCLKPQDIVRAGLSQVPEGRGLFQYMSVYENLLLGAFTRKNRDEIQKDIERIYGHFPRLEERKKQKAQTLSGGEQQMLAIACGLMADPKLLLLDEPSIGLAPIVVLEIGRIITEINRSGTAVLLVEQNARLALDIADRCYVMETGRIVLAGRSDELANSEQVKKAYLC